MSEPFIGEVSTFAGNFAPRGWAFCDGQLLPISQNTALFSLLGTTYGGDGRTTFGLPNLQGRAAVHPGRGPGLTHLQLGQTGGSPNGSQGTYTKTTGTVGSAGRSGNVAAVQSISEPEGRSPHQCVNYIIALQGLYPSRS